MYLEVVLQDKQKLYV